MEIVLLRHGKPAIDTSGKVSASDFGRWVVEYDRAGIDDRCKPADEVVAMAANCALTLCSNLPRSIESAQALNNDAIHLIGERFRECEMPYAHWRYPKLSKLSWSVLFRLLQLLGYSLNAES